MATLHKLLTSALAKSGVSILCVVDVRILTPLECKESLQGARTVFSRAIFRLKDVRRGRLERFEFMVNHTMQDS